LTDGVPSGPVCPTLADKNYVWFSEWQPGVQGLAFLWDRRFRRSTDSYSF
jgi:hypothetical protein